MKVSDPLRRILRESSSLKSTAGDKDGNVADRLILLCIYGCRTYEESNIFHAESIHAIFPIRGSPVAVRRSPIFPLSLFRLSFFSAIAVMADSASGPSIIVSAGKRLWLTECEYTGKHAEVSRYFPQGPRIIPRRKSWNSAVFLKAPSRSRASAASRKFRLGIRFVRVHRILLLMCIPPRQIIRQPINDHRRLASRRGVNDRAAPLTGVSPLMEKPWRE